MPIRRLLKNILASTAGRRSRPYAVISAAFKHSVGVSLFFVDRQRQMENVTCHIKGIDRNHILLKSRKNFLPDVLDNETCGIYFKLPSDVIVNDLRLPASKARYGFLCKSRITSNAIDRETGVCEINISMPAKYIQRELRRHERVFPVQAMIRGMALWQPPKRLPETLLQLGSPDFFYDAKDAWEMRLVDISAGGARLFLDHAKFIQEFHRIDDRQLILLISLYKTGYKYFNALMACKCVESAYSMVLHRLTLRLQFTHLWEASAGNRSRRWQPVSKNGVPAILDWVNNDYAILMGKSKDQVD